MTEFEGFAPQVREWFQGLEADNSREYFAASRDFFEASIRGQMEALLAELSQQFGGDVKMFRQNRAAVRSAHDRDDGDAQRRRELRGRPDLRAAERQRQEGQAADGSRFDVCDGGER